MSEKTLQTRIQHKHDIEANWVKATTFKPKAGEIIIYDPDPNFTQPRFKVGDGVTPINDLPFVEVLPDWNQNDETAKDYIKNRPTWTSDTVMEIAYGEYTSEFHEDLGIYGIIIPLTAEGNQLTFSLDGEYYFYKSEDFTILDGMEK